jgi:hypothetical protein
MTQRNWPFVVFKRTPKITHLEPTIPWPLVQIFVDRHFTLHGSLRLHSAAVGLDLLRAPVNILLSLVLVITRLLGWVGGWIGLRRLSDWLLRRKVLLRTSVAAHVEVLILTELLEVPLSGNPARLSRDALTRALLAAPRLRAPIRRCSNVAEAQAIADRIVTAVTEYSGTRSAIAELSTALVMLVLGALAFQSLTPGVMSMAPGLAEQLARSAAISDFPLGSTFGRTWYSIFPVGPSPGLIAMTIVCLVFAGAFVASFVGIIADPLQVRLGIHQRLLARLM